jgi:hypothetical protein
MVLDEQSGYGAEKSAGTIDPTSTVTVNSTTTTTP